MSIRQVTSLTNPTVKAVRAASDPRRAGYFYSFSETPQKCLRVSGLVQLLSFSVHQQLAAVRAKSDSNEPGGHRRRRWGKGGGRAHRLDMGKRGAQAPRQ